MNIAVEAGICPITGERMVDPVIDPEGNSYERAAIEQWLSTHDTSPITRTDLAVTDLTPNRALREALEIDTLREALELDTHPAAAPALPPALSQDVDVQLHLTEALCPAVDGEIDVLISIAPPLGSDATPSDVVCVVDTSGSMGTEATMKNSTGGEESDGLSLLDVVKHAVKTVAASLRPCDRLSLVAYSSTARVVFELLEMTDEGKQAASLAVDALSPGGMTNLSVRLAAAACSNVPASRPAAPPPARRLRRKIPHVWFPGIEDATCMVLGHSR